MEVFLKKKLVRVSGWRERRLSHQIFLFIYLCDAIFANELFALVSGSATAY